MSAKVKSNSVGTLPANGSNQSAVQGYHLMPAMKASPWKWQVPAYVALVGAGGGAQILAALACLRGDPRQRSIVRNGRLLALSSATAGAPLLIADLKTPHRFFNMLRIWRSTSPMSIGSWLLTGFGLTSAATVAADLLRGQSGSMARMLRAAGEAAQGPAALLGAGMATYTGALLSATSVPLWQAAPRLLAARFGASGVASGAAALALAERAQGDRNGNARRLEAIAAVGTAAGLVLSLTSEHAYARRGVDAPLRGTPEGILEKAGAKWFGEIFPLILFAGNALSRKPSGRASVIAALAVIGGSFALRHAIMRAEKKSAQSPSDYLSLTAATASRHGPLGEERKQRVAAR